MASFATWFSLNQAGAQTHRTAVCHFLPGSREQCSVTASPPPSSSKVVQVACWESTNYNREGDQVEHVNCQKERERYQSSFMSSDFVVVEIVRILHSTICYYTSKLLANQIVKNPTTTIISPIMISEYSDPTTTINCTSSSQETARQTDLDTAASAKAATDIHATRSRGQRAVVPWPRFRSPLELFC